MTTSLLSAHACSRLAFFTRISYLVFPFLRFPLDLIKVTEGTPLFSAEECASVIDRAEEEGVDKNEYKSGKYRLGGKSGSIR